MIIAIADDITGAAEIAGIAHRFGLKSEVHTKLSYSNADVLVIDTNTRSKTAIEAKNIIKNTICFIQNIPYEFLYKKTDSALRGHISYEINEILSNTKYSKSIFAPANPSSNRIIKNGQYYVGNILLHQTDFAQDPEFPIQSSKINDIIADDKIVIKDIQNNNDLIKLAKQIDNKTLAAGGGDFFTAILQVKNFNQKILDRILINPQKNIFIQGSLSSYSNSFVESYKDCLIPIPITMILNNNESINIWLQNILNVLKNQKTIIFKLDGFANHLLSPIDIAKRFTNLISILIKQIDYPLNLFVEGGNTATSLLRHMDVNYLDVTREYRRGIVALHTNKYEKILFTLKPGSSEWPKELIANI